ncbi:hypothetical protein C8J57DRAFT_1310989 [Mycena rebaudengoi]|nr:hypothetical protein C8J57DRAFT_1310989 [Mycena rebaudengoi]
MTYCSRVWRNCCLHQSRDYVAFVRARRDAAGVSRRLRDLVFGASCFWSCIVITPRLPVDVVHLWMLRSKERYTDVTIDFSDAWRFYRGHDVSARIYAYIRRAIPVLVPRAPGWSSLRISGMEPACCEFLLNTLTYQRLSAIRHLELACISLATDTTPLHSRMLLRDSLPIVRGGFTSLTNLDLDSIGLDWDLTPILPWLVSLQLRGISRSNFILIRHYNRVLPGAATLRRLALYSSESDPLLIVYRPDKQIMADCSLPNVDSLGLGFSGSHLLGYLVGSLVLPKLRHVDIRLQTFHLDGFLAAVHRKPGVFDAVVELALSGTMQKRYGRLKRFRIYFSPGLLTWFAWICLLSVL